MARASILSSIARSGRVNIIDAENETALALSKTASTADIIPTLDNIRQKEMKEQGGNILITGAITNITSKRVNREGKEPYYEGSVNYNISMTDLETGETVVAKDYTSTRRGESSDEAMNLAASGLSIRNLIDNVFKLRTKIIQIESAKKNKATSVYVEIGSTFGITKNRMFTIFQEKTIVGNTALIEVGSMVAEEVQGENLTLCKVLKGGEIVSEASKDPEKIVLIVETAGLRSTFSGILTTN